MTDPAENQSPNSLDDFTISERAELEREVLIKRVLAAGTFGLGIVGMMLVRECNHETWLQAISVGAWWFLSGYLSGHMIIFPPELLED